MDRDAGRYRITPLHVSQLFEHVHSDGNGVFIMLITSPANPRIAKVRDLQTTRGRKRSGLFLIEGLNLFEAALDAEVYPQEVYYQPELLQRTARGKMLLQHLISTPHLSDSQRIEVNMRVIEAISDATTSQGIVGVVSLDALSPEATRTRRATREQSGSTPVRRPALLVLDDISDPGNMGTMLRTALAADVDAVLLTPNCTDPYSPKVLRAATGTHFFLPIESDLSWETITASIRTHCLPEAPNVLLAEAGSSQLYYEVDLTHPFTLIIGNEAHGPSYEAHALATTSVTIPLANHVESLNAAIATAILLYEAVRQVQRHNNTQ